MNHWIVAPLLLPLVTGALLLLADRAGAAVSRIINLVSTAALVVISMTLVTWVGDGSYFVYALGEWPAPFGIVLVLDRLAAAMLVLCAVVALFSLVYAVSGDDEAGRYFHPLFQFQLLGINGAFLTGDLFNLFVFFEILLIASYTLLMHGQGRERTGSAVHVVALNLVGSALFLFGIGALYSVTGTLNLADLARVVPMLPPADVGLAGAAALLLLVVFGLKGALLPLTFWLPRAYAAAAAPVAALFAIMTKVGLYAIVRVNTLVFGVDAGALAGVAETYLLPVGLGTVLVGVAGALAAVELRRLIAWLVVVSVGTVLCAITQLTAEGLAAALFYTAHSTLVTAGLFLLADLIRRQRVRAGDRLDRAEAVYQPALLGVLFFIAAVSVASLPPFSGFIAKIMVLQAAVANGVAGPVWPVLLVGGLFTIVSLARAASAVFWKTGAAITTGPRAPLARVIATSALLAGSPLMALFAAPFSAYSTDTAAQLTNSSGYLAAVLGDRLPGYRRSFQ